MPKGKVLQENEAQISSKENNKPKRKRTRKKKIDTDLLNLLRVSFLLFLVGVIVFHYYLLTENQLGSFYVGFWKSNKEVLTPTLVLIGYTLTIFLIGFRVGKRR